MTKNTIQHYLTANNKTLGSLLNQLSQLQKLNALLRDSLGENAFVMDHCHVVNISSNSLIVIADSPHWLTKLRFFIPELLPKLHKHPGLEHLKAICCKAQPKIHFKSTPPIRHRLKLNAQTADKVLETTKQLKDERIKAILEKIAGY